MKTIEELKKIAVDVRVNIIKMITEAGSGHPGGSLSSVEILLTLFFNKLQRNSQNALSPDRHRLILSKGHGVPALYAVLHECGLISEEELMTLRKINSPLQGHPDRVMLPYVEASTGSLGQGLSIAQGMAMAAKLDRRQSRLYCLMGDGETQEGQVWEAILSAGKYRLDNLTAILDANKAQIDGLVKDVLDLQPIKDKLNAFHWHVIEIDGHDLTQIKEALAEAENTKGKPTYIIANTIKGKGVSFMEADLVGWHGKAPTPQQAEAAIKELTQSFN